MTTTFDSAGTYRVTLTVTNSRHRVRSASKLVTVSAPPPPPPPPTRAPAQTIAPFPIVRIVGSYSRLGVRLQRFLVLAPAGTTITIRCTGRGCPFRQQGPFVVRTVGTAAAGGARQVTIRGFRNRLLRPHAILRVYVTQSRRIGKYTSFTIRSRGAPLRADRCLKSSGTVVSCG